MPIAFINPEQLHIEPNPYGAVLEQGGFEVRYPALKSISRGESSDDVVIEQMRTADAVIAGIESYSRRVIEALPKLKVIARCGVGYDQIDVPAAARRNIPVCITPNANHECVAEHALGLMFAAAKNTIENDRNVRAGLWNRKLTEPLRGKTFGILGLGRIGRSVTVRVRALGMKVIAHECYPHREFVQTHGIELVELDDLFARSDYLSLHCPASAETDGIVNRRTLGLMKSEAVLINTARGRLIREDDLVEALQAGRLRTACIDVFDREPPRADHPFFQLPNVILAPHLGGLDKLSLRSMGLEAAENIVALYHGRWPEGAVVNGDLRTSWKW